MLDASPTAYSLRGNHFAPSPAVPVTDRGFRYGMSVFETIAVHDSRPLFPNEHLDRLTAAAAHFPLPPRWRDAATHLLNAPPISDGVIRLYVTAGDGSPTDPITTPRIFALAETTNPPDPTPATGRTIDFTPQRLPAVKTGNYWPHLAALEAARATGATEAILTTPGGRMISSSMGNVFFLLSGTLVTPPTSDGARNGVVREWVLANFPTTERSVCRTELPSVQSAFLSNSRLGVRPISRIDDRPLPMNPLVEKITTAYRTQVLRG